VQLDIDATTKVKAKQKNTETANGTQNNPHALSTETAKGTQNNPHALNTEIANGTQNNPHGLNTERANDKRKYSATIRMRGMCELPYAKRIK
jgi:hypothetical protein